MSSHKVSNYWCALNGNQGPMAKVLLNILPFLAQHPAASCSPSHKAFFPLPFVISSEEKGAYGLSLPRAICIFLVSWRANCSSADIQIYISSHRFFLKILLFPLGLQKSNLLSLSDLLCILVPCLSIKDI